MQTSFTKDGNEIDGLLFKTTETFLQMVEIARDNEMDGEIKLFYSHLRSSCLRLRNHARSAQLASSRLNAKPVKQALHHLGSLISETSLLELQSCAATLDLRLVILNLCWNEIREYNDVKARFVRRWLKREVSKDHCSEVDEGLDTCAVILDKQQLERSPFENSVEKFAPPGTDNQLSSVWKAAKSVFDALLNCKGCPCSSQHTFGARLELATYQKPKAAGINPAVKPIRPFDRLLRRKFYGDGNTAEGPGFNMFLSMERDRHHVHVQAVKKTVSFIVAGEVGPSRGTQKHTKVDRLCKPLSKMNAKNLECLVLKLIDGQLFNLGMDKSNLWIDKTTEPISLARCFEDRHEFFTEKVKRILSLILGYAVFHLDDTPWLQPGWSSIDIQFFRTSSDKTPLRPFIHTQLAETGGDSYDDRDDDGGYALDPEHHCPALISLAVILMEVYFVKPFKWLADGHQIQLTETSSCRITFTDAYQVFKGVREMDKKGWRADIPEDYRLLDAIDSCLDSSLWEDSEGAALDKETLRSRMYQYVIQPLEKYLTVGFSYITLGDVDKYAQCLDLGNWGQPMASYMPEAPIFPKSPPSTSDFPSNYRPISTAGYEHKESQFFDDDLGDGQGSHAE